MTDIFDEMEEKVLEIAYLIGQDYSGGEIAAYLRSKFRKSMLCDNTYANESVGICRSCYRGAHDLTDNYQPKDQAE